MGNALAHLRAWFSGRTDRQRVALVMQVDNITLLARCIGLAGTATLLAQLAARVGTVPGVAAPPAAGAPGQMAVILRARDRAEAMTLALRVQALCQAGFDLPDHAPTPGISAVLVRAEGAVPDGRLFDEGRRHLAQRTGGTSQVAMISVGTGAPVPGAADARVATPEPELVQLSQLVAWFQPQLCCHSGRVTGFELLARLDHPVRGLIAPGEFLPLLPPTRLRQLTRLMLAQGLAALRHWDAEGFAVGTVSLNVSASDLVEPDFADVVLWELDRQDMAPGRLVLEVIEDLSPLEMPDAVAANLARLADAGCRIDLDDFGTGYASFEALRRLRVHRVKIDRSFISGCDGDVNQQRLILAILALADRLGIEALAEGVETPAEHAFVAQIGCSHAQGFAIARPMPLAETAGFLAARREQSDLLPVVRRRA